jgi:hypothetical protein
LDNHGDGVVESAFGRTNVSLWGETRMTVRFPYRPNFEQLEQRTLPSMLAAASMSHCFTINKTITGTLSGLRLMVQHLRLGPLSGKATLTASTVDPSGNHSGTLVYKTNRGNLTFQDTGHLDLLMQQFNETVTVSRGTQALRGASGQLAINGSFNVLADTFTANVTGQICLRGR